MDTQSIWAANANSFSFPVVQAELQADVVIVGGGITGITTAKNLVDKGLSVVVLEAKQVGLGTTGYSTGNLYVTVDSEHSVIRRKWGDDIANLVVKSRTEAIDTIERTIVAYDIDCSFRRCSQFLFPMEESQIERLEDEIKSLSGAGALTSLSNELPFDFGIHPVATIENQAQFDPAAYVRSLARSISSDRCRIFENSAVTEIEPDKSVTTASGKINAPHIVLATHTPLGFNILQTVLGPYREYGIAAKLNSGDIPDGIFWTMETPTHSIRTHTHNGEKYLIVIGELHKTGQQEGVDYFQRVEDFARQHFDIAGIDQRWSAQHYRSADELAYIGPSLGSKGVYLASGFGASGLVYGPVAASIITDAILGVENPYSEIYSATRFAPLKSAAAFFKETANDIKAEAEDYLTKANLTKIEEILPGEGSLAEIDGKKYAVYRTEDGALNALSPVCPHLGCIVRWNNLEKSWDCPCHGSRFDLNGKVLEGPATSALEGSSLVL